SPAAGTNTAVISHSDQFDPVTSNNSASAIETPQQADLAISKTVNDARPNVGDVITYTVVLTNNGPDAATGVTINEPIPAGLGFVSATASLGTYNNNTGVWTVGTVFNGDTVVLTINPPVVNPPPKPNTPPTPPTHH